MASSVGAAGLLVAGIVAAAVSVGITVIAREGRSPSESRPAMPATGSPDADLRDRVAALDREVAELRTALRGLRTARGPEAGKEDGADGGPSASGPAAAGTPAEALPATAEELAAFVDRRIQARAAATPAEPAGPPPRRSVEEVGRELGFTGAQVEGVRQVQRESEEELLEVVFGTTDVESIREQVRGLRDDPDRKAAFLQTLVGNAIGNAGRLLTLESRRDARLRRFLDADQVRRLKGHTLKSALLDDELQGLLDEVF